MPRYFECPDDATTDPLSDISLEPLASDSWIPCNDGVNNLWVELGSPPNITEVGDIINLLTSLSDFSTTQVSMFIGIYLVMFITGFTAGNVIRLMKKA